MITKEQDIVITGFENSRFIGENEDVLESDEMPELDDLFVAPETFSPEETIRGRRLDIWGAGATLYVLALGKHPQDASSTRFHAA